MLGILLRRSGYDVTAAENVTSALARIIEDPPYDAVVTDLLMPDGSGMQVLDAARSRDPGTQTLMITAYATTAQAVEAMRKGAYDYIQKPFKNDEVIATIAKAVEKRVIVAENTALRAQVQGAYREGDLLGKSRSMRKIREMVRRIASAPASVLITGESGTGKEMVARAVHFQGSRGERPFVVVNCGALPESLMESELFGHEKGAFTGATQKKDGLFRAADGGTLFLDEVGELPPSLQVKLLRVLQERTVRPVGSEQEAAVDVRVVAATNRKIEDEVASGAFRQDLYYRLNVIRIELPALRERPEDIPLLAEHLLTKHGALQGRRVAFGPDALRWLAAQHYPGNIRELENVVERAVTLMQGEVVTREDLPDGGENQPSLGAMPLPSDGFDLDRYLADVEKRLLLRALAQADGVRTKAAGLLGMSFRSFRYRLAKHVNEEAGDEG